MTDALPALISLIKRFEGCRLKAYLCPAGVWTCGWGSTGPDVKADTVWTQEFADARMQKDAEHFLHGTVELCPGLAGNRLAAIADFAYNLGLGRLRFSTLRKKLNAADWAGSRAELMKWVFSKGKALSGLTQRRFAEAVLLD